MEAFDSLFIFQRAMRKNWKNLNSAQLSLNALPVKAKVRISVIGHLWNRPQCTSKDSYTSLSEKI